MKLCKIRMCYTPSPLLRARTFYGNVLGGLPHKAHRLHFFERNSNNIKRPKMELWLHLNNVALENDVKGTKRMQCVDDTAYQSEAVGIAIDTGQCLVDGSGTCNFASMLRRYTTTSALLPMMAHLSAVSP